jgi:hypothetical protein
LGVREVELEREALGGDMRGVHAVLSLQGPVIDPDMGVAFDGIRQPQAGTANALVLPQVTALGVADGAMGNEQLARREGAGVVRLYVGFGAKKSNLESPGVRRSRC